MFKGEYVLTKFYKLVILYSILVILLFACSLYAWKKQYLLSKQVQTQELRIKQLNNNFQDLYDQQDFKFLRLNQEATFYKGHPVEVWRIVPKDK